MSSSFAPKHEYHVSVTQMQYDKPGKSFQISIRIFTDDLEKGISEDNNKRIFTIKNNDQNNPFVERYIRKHFILTSGQKKAEVQYLGKEEEADATWVYLEIPFSENPEGWKLQNSILMEVFDDQVNMTNVKSPAGPKTFLFKKGQTVQSL
ncbi:DUF6702 family protein [Dyadobacter koreensis]|uniref:DUF6702 family protein n=1 Tax=Dyadobacter koreensis TaxID=408657 RepID=UPI0011601E83|nr:DUF6702 family protein [Dyadobacter koreensis]